jgi:hypothetical protein
VRNMASHVEWIFPQEFCFHWAKQWGNLLGNCGFVV